MPQSISSNYDGYLALIDINHKISLSNDLEYKLDFSNNRWFEANLTAVLGSIIDFQEGNKKNVSLINVSEKLQDIFNKNHFSLCNELQEEFSKIIKYKKFTQFNDIEFIEYIEHELLAKPDFPKHSANLGKRINQSIFEIFENARTHGDSNYIYSCGQYFPKTKKKIDFTIVDIGKTIKKNVNEFLNKDFNGCEAINWAIVFGNTTKKGDTPGGLGFGLIFDFIKLNNGKIQIISSDGYYEYKHGDNINKILPAVFLGTIVNLEFNIENDSYYLLKEENQNIDTPELLF